MANRLHPAQLPDHGPPPPPPPAPVTARPALAEAVQEQLAALPLPSAPSEPWTQHDGPPSLALVPVGPASAEGPCQRSPAALQQPSVAVVAGRHLA